MNEIGSIALFGSGETAPGAHRIHDRVMRRLSIPVSVAILETPAGFEPNSQAVAGKIGTYLEHHLCNFAPQISIVQARKRSPVPAAHKIGPQFDFDTDNPDLAAPIFEADYLFMGPGSPTYAVRHLRDSYAWHALCARHRLGAAICFSSATTLAAGRYTLPVYEIYKVGLDLHWIDGLNFFAAFGLRLIVMPHWNNNDGGQELDTSRCYMGKERFWMLLHFLPADVTILGIDENTGVVIEPKSGTCTLVGQGSATVLTAAGDQTFAKGATFSTSVLGDWHLPSPQEGIPTDIWQRACEAQAGRTQQPEVTAPQAVLTLATQRQAAREEQDWATADALRDEITALGWQVHDTPDGPRLEKAE